MISPGLAAFRERCIPKDITAAYGMIRARIGRILSGAERS